MGDEDHDHDRGLTFDPATVSRRRALTLFGGGVLAALVSCSGGTDAGSSSSTTGNGRTSGSDGDCDTIPEETAGPFPGDGSNGPDVLTQGGVVRSDIRSSFGSSTTTAQGIPLTIELSLQDATKDCLPLAGAAVYVWHCDREGRYSLYSEGVEGDNYLRGVQVSGDDGKVTFKSIFPAAYSGRWPHVHFEVYESLAAATGGGTRYATSQLALPQAACDEAYKVSGYEDSVGNMKRTTLENDYVFSDDARAQMASASGDAKAGYAVKLSVAVDPTAVSTGGSEGGPGGGPGGPGGRPPPGRR
ncbi:MAG: 3,4-dioxygenase subunit beta [Acidimicrobiia bacterium]